MRFCKKFGIVYGIKKSEEDIPVTTALLVQEIFLFCTGIGNLKPEFHPHLFDIPLNTALNCFLAILPL